MASQARFERLTRAGLAAMRRSGANDDEVFLTSMCMVCECIRREEDAEDRDGMARIAYRFIHDSVAEDEDAS